MTPDDLRDELYQAHGGPADAHEVERILDELRAEADPSVPIDCPLCPADVTRDDLRAHLYDEHR